MEMIPLEANIIFGLCLKSLTTILVIWVVSPFGDESQLRVYLSEKQEKQPYLNGIQSLACALGKLLYT